MYFGFACSSQVQAQHKGQHILTLPKEKTKYRPGSVIAQLHSRVGTCASAEGRPTLTSPIQGQQLGKLEKRRWQRENQCHGPLACSPGCSRREGHGPQSCCPPCPSEGKSEIKGGRHCSSASSPDKQHSGCTVMNQN